MVNDAESHAEEDKERRRKVEARNSLDQLVYTTEKTVSEAGDKLGAGVKAELESAIEDAKKALESDDLATLEAAAQNLTQASHKLAEEMYKQSGATPGAGPEAQAAAGAAGGGDDEVIDAEYVDVDEKAN